MEVYPMAHLYTLFSEQVKLHPDKIALSCGEHSITYLQLASEVEKTTTLLKQNNIVAGNYVIIYMTNSIEAIQSMLAIHKIGAVVLPLDVSLPLERIKRTYEDTHAAVVLSNHDKLSTLMDVNTIVIPSHNVNEVGDTEFQTSESMTLEYAASTIHQCSEQDIAFCIYTSGSEGKPKGVLLPHHTICNQIEGKKQLLGLSASSTLCQSLSIGFVASIWQIYGSLTLGAHLVIYPDDTIKNPLILFDKVNQDHVDVISIVPQLLRSYCLLIQGKHNKAILEHLKYVILTGEKLSGDIVRSFYQHHHIPIINAYGQSECSDDTFYYEVPFDFADVHVPIGYPTLGVSPFILDEQLHVLEGACRGELSIGGPCLSSGYLNDTTLTNQKFICPESHTTMVFRTGDYVERTEEGVYIYLGRLDNQIKVRGYRISLEEIEYYMQQYTGVEKAAVAALEDGADNKEIIGFYLSSDEIDHARLKQYLQQILAPYSVPSRFIKLDQFIYTASGKCDRKKMLEEYTGSFTETTKMDAAELEVEGKVLKIIKAVVSADGVENLTMDTTFEELSITSMLFIQIVVACEDLFNFMFDEEMISYAQFKQVSDLISYITSKTDNAKEVHI
jgi:amino acid adenylation domain-containing protein